MLHSGSLSHTELQFPYFFVLSFIDHNICFIIRIIIKFNLYPEFTLQYLSWSLSSSKFVLPSHIFYDHWILWRFSSLWAILGFAPFTELKFYMWIFQWFDWHSLPQYITKLHLPHPLNVLQSDTSSPPPTLVLQQVWHSIDMSPTLKPYLVDVRAI